jgi:hypothetical protein
MQSDDGAHQEEAAEAAVSRVTDAAQNYGSEVPPSEPLRGDRAGEDTNAAEDPDNGWPPHDLPKMRGVPENALHPGAERLNDPDKQRQTSVDVGRRLQAVAHKHLFGGDLVDKLCDGLGVIRKGAPLNQPAQREELSS